MTNENSMDAPLNPMAFLRNDLDALAGHRRLVVVAGANGAGKTTLVRRLGEVCPQVLEAVEVINPDEIMFAQCPDNPMRAGRLALLRRRALMAGGKDFLVETTLAGNSTVELVLEAVSLGYKVVFVYIGLDSVELHKARVRARVAAGGHDIAEKDIERRRERSLANVAKVLPMADRFLLLDNSGDDFLTLMRVRGDKEVMRAQELPAWVPGCLSA